VPLKRSELVFLWGNRARQSSAHTLEHHLLSRQLTQCYLVYVCRLRTSKELWQLPERELAVTANCYIFSRGDAVLAVTTNSGSSSGSVQQCSVQLPADFTLLDGGLDGVQDVTGGQVRCDACTCLQVTSPTRQKQGFGLRDACTMHCTVHTCVLDTGSSGADGVDAMA
jgi:hypothetical protein